MYKYWLVLTLLLTGLSGCDLSADRAAAKINADNLLDACLLERPPKDFENGFKECQFAMLWMERVQPDSFERATIQEKLGDYLAAAGNHAAAAVNDEAAYVVLEKQGGDRAEQVELLLKIATEYLTLGQWAQSEAVLKKVEPLVAAEHGKDSPELADVYNRLGVTALHQRNIDAAWTALQQALQIREFHQKGEPALAETYSNLGYLFQLQGKLKEAGEYYEKAMAIHEAARELPYVPLFDSLSNLAVLQQQLGNPDAAEASWNRLLGIADKGYGNESPQYALVLNNLGRIEMARQNYVMAENHFALARALLERKLGANSLETAEAAYNQAKALEAQGKIGQALQLIRYAASLSQLQLGMSNPVCQQRWSDMINLENQAVKLAAVKSPALPVGKK